MPRLLDTRHFTIDVPVPPHVDRLDGGHLIISPRVAVIDRTQLPVPLAIELMVLTLVAGEAMQRVLPGCGIDLGRINYQDNGNWHPQLHVHLYGRARSAVRQPFGQALVFPRDSAAYADVMPFTSIEVAALQEEMLRLFATEKYVGRVEGVGEAISS